MTTEYSQEFKESMLQKIFFNPDRSVVSFAREANIPGGCNYKCGYYAALFIEPPAQYSSHLLFALSVLRASISSAISFFHHAPVSFNLD